MKWFFRFAIFWMLPCISDGPDVTCSGPVMIVKIRTPSPCGSCASEALRPSGGEGRRVPPRCLPVCATRICSFFGRMLAIARVCVCARVWGECVSVRDRAPALFFFSFHLNLLLLLCLSTSNLAARDLRGRRCALCFWREEEGEWGWSGWWRDERGQVRRRHRSAPFLFPPSPSLSLLLSLPLSLWRGVCACLLCVLERESETGRLCFSRLDCEPAQEEAALSRLRYVTELSSHAFPQYLRHVGRFVIEWKTGCWRR